jgi:N4-gp56 family major capsid protein
LVFTKLSSSSPKVISDHRGTKLVGRRYFPVMDDRNLGSHGLDSAGEAIEDYQNLYGESLDISDILDKSPVLSEYGGRVNRVGFTRETYEATCQEFGIFFEWTRNSLKFDDDTSLYEILVKELLTAGYYINEDRIAVDLIQGSQTIVYGGVAKAQDEVTGNVEDEPSVLGYEICMTLSEMLDEAKCPADTMVYAGSRNIDTLTVPRARFAFIGTKLRKSVLKAKDYFGEKALMQSRHYVGAKLDGHGLQDRGVLTGEIGFMDNGLRFIVVDRMPYEKGKGKDVTENAGYHETGGKYDTFPMLVVGSGSYSNLKFSSDYKESGLFEINWKNPKENGGMYDPFHRNGYYSISWSQGTLICRPEWIGLGWFVAEL